MSNDHSRSSMTRHGYGGINLLQMLGVLFIALKLTGNIDWSWWLVLLPLAFHIIAYTVLMLALLFLLSSYIARFLHSTLFGESKTNG